MFERCELDDAIVSSRRALPSSEIDPRQLAALLRIEALLTEIRDVLKAASVAPPPPPADSAPEAPSKAAKTRRGA